MAVGSKYAPLTEMLQNCGEDIVRLTFDELNRVITIPSYAYKDRSSWANLTKPTSFCSSWINAGYHVHAISLQERWVEFRNCITKGRIVHLKPGATQINQSSIITVLQCGYNCYNGIATDPNHRYLSWEHCHTAFKKHRQKLNGDDVDYLCLHLAWYLASWGMLRNSFLMQKDYKIHANVVYLLYQPEWDELWDIDSSKLAQERYATHIIKLSNAITATYVNSGVGRPTDTLLTKILLGTLGCTPAYDRYFRKALSLTRAAPQNFNIKSLTVLGKLYINHKNEFEAFRRHCSERIEYPVAKVIDMCFFEYGFQMDTKS